MVEQRNDSRAAVLGGGVSHPSQLTTGLVIKSVTTSPTLAGERMLFILQVSILSEQKSFFHLFPKNLNIVLSTSTRSQNDGKYLYFTRLNIVLPEKIFLYRLRTLLCDEIS